MRTRFFNMALATMIAVGLGTTATADEYIDRRGAFERHIQDLARWRELDSWPVQ